MPGELDGRTIALLIAPQGTEQSEFEEPRAAILHAGGAVVVVGIEAGDAQAVHGDLEPGDTFAVDSTFDDIDTSGFDGVIVPGGTVGADKLRSSAAAVQFVRSLVDVGRPAAAICHGPWVLVEAGVVEGRTLTSYPSLRTDIRNAGGDWVDEEVVRDGNLITSRNPGDLPAFCRTLVEAFAEG